MQMVRLQAGKIIWIMQIRNAILDDEVGIAYMREVCNVVL